MLLLLQRLLVGSNKMLCPMTRLSSALFLKTCESGGTEGTSENFNFPKFIPLLLLRFCSATKLSNAWQDKVDWYVYVEEEASVGWH